MKYWRGRERTQDFKPRFKSQESYWKELGNKSKGKSNFPGCQLWRQGRTLHAFLGRRGFFPGGTDLRPRQTSYVKAHPALGYILQVSNILCAVNLQVTPGGSSCCCQPSDDCIIISKSVKISTHHVCYQRWCKMQRGSNLFFRSKLDYVKAKCEGIWKRTHWKPSKAWGACIKLFFSSFMHFLSFMF